MFVRSMLGSVMVSLVCSFLAPCSAAELEWIKVSKEGRGFVRATSGKKFVPWGFNYDHDRQNRLIEDYWDKEWPSIEGDFQEMRALGANVVRIHLQFSKFMDAADRPNSDSLKKLGQLIALAEKTGLYLNLTGLGCYHKKDVPAWYDALEEPARWQAQANFWAAVAKQARHSPAIFCYDLMNEPVVPGGKGKRTDWLGGAFGDKHFVQFVALESRGRKRPEIAAAWTAGLVAAIRKHDQRHLITVGMVDWSLNRPGLTSGFEPKAIVPHLDFLSVHIYPMQGKLEEALETLRGFSVGKPVVIEEIFPLKCDAGELGRFIDRSREHASGWTGFYWGKTPAEYKTEKSIQAAMMLSWLDLFGKKAKEMKGDE